MTDPRSKNAGSGATHSGSARDEILGKLRNSLANPELRFPPLVTPMLTNEERMVVTEATGGLVSDSTLASFASLAKNF